MKLKNILISGVAMLGLDFIYLSAFSKFFNNLIYSIQGSPIKMNIVGAVLCYILLIFGLNYFIITPKKSLTDAFLLGLVIYGVYETTSYAIIRKWKPEAVALDTLWGGILMALTTKITYAFLRNYSFQV
jgi:uncharacterized membrane protein